MPWNPTRKSGSLEAGNFSQVHSVCLEFGGSNRLIMQVNHVTSLQPPCNNTVLTTLLRVMEASECELRGFIGRP